LTLSQIAKEIIGKSQVFIKYPADEVLNGTTQIKDYISEQSLITDLVIRKKVSIKAEDGKQQDKEVDEVVPPIVKA
jgi:hypothetical protein